MRLTKRYIIESIDGINLSKKVRYERYYIDERLRIQKKDDLYEKEILNDENVVINKSKIPEEEFLYLKSKSYLKIIRDSYLYLKDNRVSIKKYYGEYNGLNRVEVKFSSKKEMEIYVKESWMGKEITFSPLAFDKELSKLSKEEFLKELSKYI